MEPPLAQPNRRPGRPLWAWLLALAGVAALLILAFLRDGTDERPSADGRPLIVWVANNDSKGVAIAFNELKDAYRQNLKYHLRDWFGWRPSGQSEVLRRLLKGDKMPDVQLTWEGPARVDGPPPFAIEFRFIPNGGLLRSWKPLFLRLAGRLAPHHAGCPAGQVSPKDQELSKDDQDWYDRMAKELSKDDQDWYDRMAKDVRDSPDRLLILGPDSSDAVPALWFALCTMSPGSTAFPPTVTLAATSSLLDYEWDDLADSGANRTRGMWYPPYSGPDAVRPNWYTSLGRMLGYCEDDLGHATSCEQEQIGAVVAAIRSPARSFIQFAASDRMLVEASFAYLHDVQGFQRIGLLYPDPPARSDGLVRLLYGPTLREQYQSRAGGISVRDEQVILPATYLNPPDSKGPPTPNLGPAKEGWQDPTFLGKLADTLRPTLKFFRQSGVEAVGVFGSTDARLAVLPLVRTELPKAQLFTSDATWRLESPAAPEAPDRAGSGKGGGDAARGTGRTPSLDGLLVFTSSQPPRRWVEAQFVDFGPQAQGEIREPFLPDTFQFYTAHVVKRLIELVQQGRLGLLTRDEGVGELAQFLHLPTNLGRSDLRGRSVPVQISDPRIETMIIREGKLGPLAEPKDLFLSLGAVGLPLIVLTAQYFHQARRRGGADPTAPETGLVISPLFFVYHGVRSAAALARREPQPEASRVQADWRRLLGNDLLLVSLLVTAFLLVAGGTLAFDGWWLGLPVSWSPWPDGHSVFPSLFLAAVAVVLAHHIPYRFEEELSRSGLVRDPRRRPQAMESWVLRRWAPPFSQGELEAMFDDCVKRWVEQDVFPALTLTRKEALSTAFVAAAFTSVEAAAGMPVSRGVSYPLLLLGEFVVAWVVVATAWTLYQLSGMPAKLRERLQKTEGLRLGQLDTSSVTRMGSIFIETIAYLLVVLALLMVGGLSEYNMARWSQFVVKGVPCGALLVGVALAFILWYWLYCYTTLKGLILSVKMDRLDELESIRSAAIKPQPVPLHLGGRDRELASPKKKEEEDLQKVAEELEKQRRAVEEVSEEPWKASASWRAWFALGVLLLPSVLSALFGSWGETLLRPLRALAGPP
jgi:hypothetical protein